MVSILCHTDDEGSSFLRNMQLSHTRHEVGKVKPWESDVSVTIQILLLTIILLKLSVSKTIFQSTVALKYVNKMFMQGTELTLVLFPHPKIFLFIITLVLCYDMNFQNSTIIQSNISVSLMTACQQQTLHCTSFMGLLRTSLFLSDEQPSFCCWDVHDRPIV
jgi:hypothetical protein